MILLSEKDNAVIFTLRVAARASQSALAGELDGALKVKIAAAPVNGAANTELIKFLAKTFGVAKACIEIIGGQTSKTKRIKIEGATTAQIRKLL